MAHSLGICQAAELACGIQEHHDQLAPGHMGLHHKAASGFGDIAGLLQADIPVVALDQTVGVVELQRAATDGHFIAGRCGVLAHQRIGMRHRHQARQIACAGLVAAGQAGGLHIARVLHAQLQRLGVHQLHKLRQTAGISASQGMGSTVLAGHQRQMHHLGTRQGGTDTQAGAAVLFGIHIVLRDGDHLIHGQAGLRDQQTGHQLGQRGNRQHCLIVLAQQHLMCVLVNHISHAALQIQGIRDGVKTRHLPVGQACGLDCRGSSCCRNRSTGGSCSGQTLFAAGLLVSFGLGC